MDNDYEPGISGVEHPSDKVLLTTMVTSQLASKGPLVLIIQRRCSPGFTCFFMV